MRLRLSSSRETRFADCALSSLRSPCAALGRLLLCGERRSATHGDADRCVRLSLPWRLVERAETGVAGNLGYDHQSGWYGGLFASTVQLGGEAATTGQAVAYLGVATRIGDDLHWDVGADYSAFSDGRDYDYGEVYTGIAT